MKTENVAGTGYLLRSDGVAYGLNARGPVGVAGDIQTLAFRQSSLEPVRLGRQAMGGTKRSARVTSCSSSC